MGSDTPPAPAGVEATQLAYLDYNWALDVKSCPCDVQFVEWLDDRAINDATIFHFGTGHHHYVGIECAKQSRRNSVLGITAAPGEHGSFIELVTEQPELLRYYNVMFGDIYLLNDSLLPTFDVVTLFHLCEFRNWQHDSYGAMTDLEVATLLTDHVRPGGHILFYEGSLAFEWPDLGTRAIIDQWRNERNVELAGKFKTLIVFRKSG